MNQSIISTFCCALLLVGCNRQPKNHGLKMDFSETIQIPLSDISDSTVFKLSTVFTDIKRVPLEETPNSMIGYISQMEIANNGDFIVFDQANKVILRFDSCGNYLNAIGARGHGPNEYTDPFYMSYDRFHDEILVTDHGKQEIQFFDLSGKIVHKTKTPFYSCATQTLDEEHILYYRGYNNQEGFNFIIEKRNSTEYDYFDPLPENYHLDYLPDMVGTIIHGKNGEILCRPTFSSICYEITGTKVKPKYQFVPESGDWVIGESKDIDKLPHRKNNTRIEQMAFINDKLYMKCSGKDKNGAYFVNSYYNDLNGTVFSGKYHLNDVKGNGPIFGKILNTWGKRLYAVQGINASDTKDNKATNPCVMILTVKD